MLEAQIFICHFDVEIPIAFEYNTTMNDWEKMSTEVYVKDKQGRTILKIVKERVMVMRLPDMDEYTKDQLVYLYSEFTSEDPDKLRKFLNFEDDINGNNEFCS